MKAVCARLHIPALEVNFVRAYWTAVFAPFVDDFRSNTRTPNPDANCNAHIKFHKFRQHVLREGEGGGRGGLRRFDCMATGHYVRLQEGDQGDTRPASVSVSAAASASTGMMRPRLLRGLDRTKDQSYFLSTTAVQCM